MNTKILVALVIATALVGLTGAASAASYTGAINYDFAQIIDTEAPTTIDVNSGACFMTIIEKFDANYGIEQINDTDDKYDDFVADPGGNVYVGAGVFNTMVASPEYWYSEGAEYQVATQGGSAAIAINTKKTGGEPEVAAMITSDQSLLYSGSFSGYFISVNDKGMAGAYGLLSDGLDYGFPGIEDDCGNIILKSYSHGSGSTLAWPDAKLTGGTFSFSSFEGMTVDLEGVELGKPIIDIYGGVTAASTFVGVGQDISTHVSAGEWVSVEKGWDADNLDDFCIDP